MNVCHRFWMAAVELALVVAAAPAVDLAKIDHTIDKEPVYLYSPRYCLLVFGAEAKTRVWLVLDGNTLYVGRSGTGELLEKKHVLRRSREHSGKRQCSVGDIMEADGRTKHTDLRVTCTDDDAEVSVTTAQGLRQVAHFHAGQYLQFADRAQDAPIIHFAGPLTMGLRGRPTLTPGEVVRLVPRIGTPGRGNGTFAMVVVDSIVGRNSGIAPLAELEFPGAAGQTAPIKGSLKFKYVFTPQKDWLG
jgi:hypothetical protein